MASSIIIKDLELSLHCGVTESERIHLQPILVDLSIACPNEPAFKSDQLKDTVDYAAVIQCLRDIVEKQTYLLLEKVAEDITQTLFQRFSLTQLKIWVRKVLAPIPDFSGSVGIRLVTSRKEYVQTKFGNPSPFLIAQLPRLPRGKALDVATGRGRHAHFLATRGFSVHGIDCNQEALDFLETQSREAGGLPITTECLDLETNDLHPPDLGTEQYDLVLGFFYLYRPLFPRLLQALKPGGVLIYETFLLDNHVHRHHPRRKEFCLAPNELLTLLHGLQILHYDEGDHQGISQSDPAFTARIVARKPNP